ncbi:MAG: MFS transporter [Actinomycetota bacterium]
MGVLVDRALELLLPGRLGSRFRLLFWSTLASNLGDGIALAAGPLLMAAQTRDPILIALAGLLPRLPWLLFGLHAGVVADRLDRRRIMVAANLTRAGVLGVLVLTIVTGTVSAVVVLTVLFLLGTAETLADTATITVPPMILASEQLGLANSRLIGAHLTVNQLVGPSVGAVLFVGGMSLPFVLQGVLLIQAAVLAGRIDLRRSTVTAPASVADAAAGRPRIRTEIADGLRWLRDHPPIRTLTLTIVAFNITFGAAFAVLVLYAIERLGLGEVGFGLLHTTLAAGGVVGAAGYGWLERRYSLADLMRAGLVIETLTHLVLALTEQTAVAFPILFLFGIHASVWGTTASSIRQRAVPEELQGRVGGVYMTGVQGGIVIGAALGGVLADAFGITAPIWFAFAGSAVLLVLLWRELEHVAHADGGTRPVASPDAGPGPDPEQ